MDEKTTDAIQAALKKIIAGILPKVRYLPKYGGEVLALDPESDRAFVGGIFGYKDHVTLEFSNGATFDDPKGQLDGTGKKRRHLKFHTLDDVAARDVAGFLKQAH